MPQGSDIGPEESLVQTAYALDAAGVMAEKLNDVEGMLAVGAMWMKLGETISNMVVVEPEPKPSDIIGSNHKTGVGFQAAPVEQDDAIIIEEEQNARGK